MVTENSYSNLSILDEVLVIYHQLKLQRFIIKNIVLDEKC